MNHFKRTILLGAGFLFLALGIVGMFLPIMPGILFLVIASICFSKSSETFHNLLINNKWVGSHIRNYHENKGIKIETKAFLIIFQWAAVWLTSFFFVPFFWGRLVLAILAIGSTIFILSLKTTEK